MTARVWTVEEVRALGVRTDLSTAGSVLGVGRTAAYEMARTGTWPTPLLRLGARYVVPVAGLLGALGLQDQGTATNSNADATHHRPSRRGVDLA